MKRKVILDTDIGFETDPDDALALAYLLANPDCELVGISTVGLHSGWRAEMADVICDRMGKPEIPIVAGADRPVFANQYWMENPVRRWPEDARHQPREEYESNQAVEWLRKKIRAEAPGEISLITIGQFTNLATLLLVDPEVIEMLDQVVCMGGQMNYPADSPEGETNVILDPVAAGIVVQRMDELTLLPIGPVRGKGLSAAFLDDVLSDEKFKPVRRSCQPWYDVREVEGVGLADPMTTALVFEPDLVELESGRVNVHLYDHPLPEGEPFENDGMSGATRFEPNPAGGHRVVTEVARKPTHRHVRDVFRNV